MAANIGTGRAVSSTFAPLRIWLLLPGCLSIGFFLLIPVLLMLVYSFLTKEFRCVLIWEPTLAAYDQFFFDRGLFGEIHGGSSGSTSRFSGARSGRLAARRCCA